MEKLFEEILKEAVPNDSIPNRYAIKPRDENDVMDMLTSIGDFLSEEMPRNREDKRFQAIFRPRYVKALSFINKAAEEISAVTGMNAPR